MTKIFFVTFSTGSYPAIQEWQDDINDFINACDDTEIASEEKNDVQ